MVSPFPRNRIDRFLLWGAVKLVGSRRPVGKVGETHCVFPGLSIGDRACAVRRGWNWASMSPPLDELLIANSKQRDQLRTASFAR
jgi:hypothetical protein